MGGVKLDVSGNRKCTWIEEVIIIVPRFILSVNKYDFILSAAEVKLRLMHYEISHHTWYSLGLSKSS